MQKKGIVYIFTAAIISVMAVSCGSSRKTVRGSDGHSTKTSKTTTQTKHEEKFPEINTKELHPHQVSLLQTARTWLGTPYAMGGHSREKTDCSGFLMEVYLEAMGVKIPRTTSAQQEYCRPLNKEDLLPGDILFFSSNNSGGKTAHVGMYIGDGEMIHASSSKGVIVSNIGENYYTRHYQASGRVPALHDALTSQNTKKNAKVAQKKEEKTVEKASVSASENNSKVSVSVDTQKVEPKENKKDVTPWFDKTETPSGCEPDTVFTSWFD